MKSVSLIFFIMSESFLIPAFSFAVELSPPTSRAFPENVSEYADYVQTASSGRKESGMFGMTRDEGARFHEGMDIRSFFRDDSGKPADGVFAVLPGKISHLCGEINGSYGRYVVLEHSDGKILFYTLYAHLDSLNPTLSEGQSVEKGEFIGVLGRTSSVYDFPKGTEHLHFEVGLRLGGESFIRWYERTFSRDDKNLHSFWNGLNLSGTDPTAFFSSFPRFRDFSSWMDSTLNTAFSVVVRSKKIPEILEFSPGLLRGSMPEGISAWRADFSWSGMPLRFYPLEEKDVGDVKEAITLDFVYEKYLLLSEKRGMILNSGGRILPGKRLRSVAEIIFGEDFRE